jgi:hypothetical protein
MANSASNDIIKSLQSASEEILASRPNPNEEDNYELRAKVCTRLSREICLSELQFVVQELSQEDGNEWTAPSKPGLENCDEIIPSYYHFHKHPSKIMDIDYFEIIKDDVRNYRVLNHRQLLYINNLTHEEKRLYSIIQHNDSEVSSAREKRRIKLKPFSFRIQKRHTSNSTHC